MGVGAFFPLQKAVINEMSVASKHVLDVPGMAHRLQSVLEETKWHADVVEKLPLT